MFAVLLMLNRTLGSGKTPQSVRGAEARFAGTPRDTGNTEQILKIYFYFLFGETRMYFTEITFSMYTLALSLRARCVRGTPKLCFKF